MTKEKQKEFVLLVAQKHNLTSKVIESLFMLVDENKHWRCKGINALELAFRRLATYSEAEQIQHIEKAIIGQYRGLVWRAKEQPKQIQQLSKTEQIHNLFRQ